jgi:hypothetical protein
VAGQPRRTGIRRDPVRLAEAGQTQTLLQSLVAQGLVSAQRPDGSPSYHTVLYIGRGVPDAWIVPGQTISVSDLTSSYNVATGHRDSYGVRISTGSDHGATVVRVTLTGQVPGNGVQVQLPVFADAGVRGVSGGSYDAASHTVTLSPGRRSAAISLGNAAKPALSVQVASTVPGQHAQPTLTSGAPTTASATITNTSRSDLSDVRLALRPPSGWTSTPTTAASFAASGPGQTQTVSWNVTPPSSANGGSGLIVSASYDALYGASGTASAEK